MAKAEMRDGRWKAASHRKVRRLSTEAFDHYESILNEKKRANQQPVFGPKMQIINAYKQNKNIEDAYNLAEEINQKMGKEVYSKKMVESWIAEEVRKENRKDRNRDENDDAR